MQTIKIKFNGHEKVITLPRIEFKFGDFVWIKGDSGTGKSTLLMLMKGIIPKYIHAYVEGDVPLIEDAAYLFQNANCQIVSPFVLEELAFSMENLRFDSNIMNERIDSVNQMLGVNFHSKDDTYCLSGGEKQLLTLASMLAVEPQVILLDEPTASLDPSAREKFYTVLYKLKGKHTVFLVDHNYRAEFGLHNKTYEIQSNETLWAEERSLCKLVLPAVNCGASEICVRNLTFKYLKHAKLLENFSMSVKSGEIVAVTGDNGSGKTTLLHLIAGMLKASSGTIEVRGQLSLALQNAEHYFYFDRVKDELPSGYDSWIKHFGLWNAMNQSPFSLSEGEKRRLAVLMVVLENRPIILYDEPTYGQDQCNIEKICQLMLALKKQGRVQVIVTHDRKLASQICDRVYEVN